MSTAFRYIRFWGTRLSPEALGREPSYEDVRSLYERGKLHIDFRDYVSVKIRGMVIPTNEGFEETIWLSRETYEYARDVLSPKNVFYEAHEGVTFTSAEGAWLIVGDPQPVEPSPGVSSSCVRVETELSRSLGLPPFIMERDYVFKGFKGEDIERGYIKSYRYFIAAYDRSGNPLSEDRLRNTLLWRNYLSNEHVIKTLGGVSKFLRKRLWSIERMGYRALARYKVVWRDVAKEFIPAVVVDGSIPDYTVNYIVVNSVEEAYYLLAVLLSPQINAVVRELQPWIGHVQPRFIRYFKIPKYDPDNGVHRELSDIGREISVKKEVSKSKLNEIELLVVKL